MPVWGGLATRAAIGPEKRAMDNLHLFELINAPPGSGPGRIALALLLARWAIGLIPFMLAHAWWRGDEAARSELLQIVLAMLLALGLAQVVTHVWPQPRPSALHVGTQYLAHGSAPGLPSDPVTVFWSVAFAALASRRYALWSFPLLALGLLVGWSQVYLGVHLPFDILAALPLALSGTAAAGALRGPLRPTFGRILSAYDRAARSLRAGLRPSGKP